ncbi:MAG: glycerophosphoryl diester phosphodiesterase, partial [Acidobacteriaceae bacterium]|nr:glycerophosphoryl diester phosphodiesterase [Acidobacteriaceae bacterium]
MAVRPLLLGHRGARATLQIAENSIESFDKALEHGCDGFEFDVRLAADGSAVVCHDARVKGLKISLSSQADLPNLARLKHV